MADGDEDPHEVERPVTEDTDAIWSTDDIPVRDGPLDFVWAPRPSEPDTPMSPAGQGLPFDEPVTASPVDATSEERNLRSKLLIGAVALVAVAIAVGSLVRSGDTDEQAAPVASNETGSTIDVATTTPTTMARLPSTTLASGGAQADLEISTEPIDVELPPPVAAIQTPTEIVMLTTGGLVRTLSLPSGRVRSVALAGTADTDASMFGGGNVVVAPDAAAILRADGRAVVVVPRTGPPIDVNSDEFGADIGGLELQGWRRAGDGTTQFIVVTYPEACCDTSSFTSVGLDGEVVPLVAPHAGPSGNQGLTTPDGSWIVNDAGGTYEVDANGTSRRIDSGIVLAAVRDHRLVRECDDALRCSTVLVHVSNGERRIVDPDLLPDDFGNMTYGMSLAPDGSAISVVRNGPTQERVLIDLDVGEVAAAPAVYWSPGSTWAADSSGFFDIASAGPGLRFTPRTGETVGFGAGLDQVIAFGVRWPDAELDPDVIVVTELVSAARPLGTTGITLVGAMTGGGMTYIDIDASVSQSWAATQRLASDLTLITSGGATLAFGDAGQAAFAFRRGVQQPLSGVFATEGVKLPGLIDGTIWVPAPELGTSRSGVAYRLVTSDGLPVDGATIDLPEAELIGSDGHGGLVVARGGDVFVVSVDGAERLSSGELIAIAADTAYVRECTEVTACDVTRIDRRTGVRSSSDGGIDADDLTTASTVRGTALGTSVSPDGDVLLVQLTNVSPEGTTDTSWFFADTTTQRLTAIDDLQPDQPVIWSADSSFAAVLADTNLLVFDRAAGELVPLSAPKLRAIGQASITEPVAVSE